MLSSEERELSLTGVVEFVGDTERPWVPHEGGDACGMLLGISGRMLRDEVFESVFGT